MHSLYVIEIVMLSRRSAACKISYCHGTRYDLWDIQEYIFKGWYEVLQVVPFSDGNILFMLNISTGQDKFASSFHMSITDIFPFWFETHSETELWLYHPYYLLKFSNWIQRNLQHHFSGTSEYNGCFLQH